MTEEPIECPTCGSEEFEARGDRRCYARLTPDLEIDGWNEGEIGWDSDEQGEEIIYCCSCDSEFSRAELRGGNG